MESGEPEEGPGERPTPARGRTSTSMRSAGGAEQVGTVTVGTQRRQQAESGAGEDGGQPAEMTEGQVQGGKDYGLEPGADGATSRRRAGKGQKGQRTEGG